MPMTKKETASTRALDGRTAIVTGSTSGIGLGIARALAAQGSNLVLNGFGDPAGIAGLRGQLAGELNVNVMFDGANKRFATVEEMGALAVFLCSDAAASITGTSLPVDGGWTAH